MFDRDGFQRVGGGLADSFTVWAYSTDDSRTDVEASDYFRRADTLKTKDYIIVLSDDFSSTYRVDGVNPITISRTPSDENNGFVVIDQPGHGFKNGQPIYRDTGSYQLGIASQADGLIKGELVGVVASTATDSFTVVQSGKITGVDGSVTDSTLYFVSSTIAGERVTTAPSSPDYEIPFLIGLPNNEAVVKLNLGVIGA